ncbi:hypothetical protein G7084_00395 [Weissella coleopterorum]|uniref:Uncharacterized protein n=1 Tax=Weissella coleopterorum TaxID=2714949 RepID=A0A6G8AY34_9LACO|nr:hypothetical protein [Weissella coleopterorum]QIL49917.1 hypothetical protein G7084_00395 [Weissella coleopterorum]
MAIDTKKLAGMGEAALVELKTLMSLSELPAINAFRAELKNIDESELFAVSPMLPEYVESTTKNMRFLVGNYNSTITHAKNRSGEVEVLMAQLTNH